jgi:hypothetical protein
MATKLNPFAKVVAVSVVDNMMASANTLYDARHGIIVFDLSIGVGKSSTKVEISNLDAYAVSDALRGFDPDKTYTKAETIARTIERVDPTIDATNADGTPETVVEKDKEGNEKIVATGRQVPDPDEAPYVRFLTSTKKNTRYVNVPVSEWEAFTSAIDQLADNADAVLDSAKEQHIALEKQAAAAAAKKAGSLIK